MRSAISSASRSTCGRCCPPMMRTSTGSTTSPMSCRSRRRCSTVTCRPRRRSRARRSAGRCRSGDPDLQRPRLLVQNARLSEDLPVRLARRDRRSPRFPGGWRVLDQDQAADEPLRLHSRPRPAASARGAGRRRPGRAVRGRRRGPRIAGARQLRRRDFRQPGVGEVRARCRREPRGPLHRQGRHTARRRDVRRRAERGARRRPAAPSGVVSARHRRNAVGRRRRRERRDRRSVCRRRRRRHAEPAPHPDLHARVQRQRPGVRTVDHCRRSRAAPTAVR